MEHGRNSDLNVVVFSVLLAVYLCINIPSSVLLWRRRNFHPVKARQPHFLVFFNCIGAVVTVFACVNRIAEFGLPCIFLNSHLSSWYFSSFAIRAIVLWFRFKQVHAQMDVEKANHTREESTTQSQSDENEKPLRRQSTDFWLKRKDLTSSKYMVLYASISFAFCIVATPVAFFKGECFTPETPFSDSISTVNNLVILVIALGLAYKLRTEYDYFWLKAEFFYGGISAIFTWVAWIVVAFLSTNANSFAPSTLIAVLFNLCLTVTSCTLPVYLSFKVEKQNLNSTNSTLLKMTRVNRVSSGSISEDEGKLKLALKEILQDSVGYALFEEFLIGEFCVEGLMFYKSVQKFEKEIQKCCGKNNLAIMVEFAVKIFQNFVQVGSKLEVNLSSFTRDLVEANMQQITAKASLGSPESDLQCFDSLQTLFTPAAEEILSLLAKDSFIRFRFRPEAQEYFKTKKTRLALSNANLI